jgi:hypothetical protein
MKTPLRNDFDAFLFAPIGKDAGGIPVSLLTALARLDIDAWEEAASLAHMPTKSATHRLASLLAKLPNGPEPGEAVRIATRLVELLHPAPVPPVRSAEAPPLRVVAAQSRRVGPAIYFLIALIIMLVWQWIEAIRQPRFPLTTSLEYSWSDSSCM